MENLTDHNFESSHLQIFAFFTLLSQQRFRCNMYVNCPHSEPVKNFKAHFYGTLIKQYTKYYINGHAYNVNQGIKHLVGSTREKRNI